MFSSICKKHLAAAVDMKQNYVTNCWLFSVPISRFTRIEFIYETLYEILLFL